MQMNTSLIRGRLNYNSTLIPSKEMFQMNTKQKGNIGESRILYEFTRYQIQVAIPYGDNARYDLIAEFDGRQNRIQIKYCDQKIINNSICCPCASSKNHTTNKRRDTYTNDVDYMAFYIVSWDACCLVSIREIGDRKSICFRQKPPASGQVKGIHQIRDYSFDKTLCVETLHDEPKPEVGMVKRKSGPRYESNAVK